MQWADQRCICPVVRLRMVEGGYKLSSIAEKASRIQISNLGKMYFCILRGWGWIREDTYQQYPAVHLCIFCVFLYLCYCAVEKGGYKLAVTVARFTSQSSANSKPSIQQVPPEIIQSCNNTGGQFTIQGRCRNYRREIAGGGGIDGDCFQIHPKLGQFRIINDVINPKRLQLLKHHSRETHRG